MAFSLKFKSFIKRIGLLPEIICLIACVFLLGPFFILSFFNCPSVDDFFFALKAVKYGYWGSQAYVYTAWHGRYFSSFILCAHPLVFHSFVAYKFLSFALLATTIHSIYYFLTVVFKSANKTSKLVLSCLISFCFFDQMPSLVQGIYWAPGAVTYQLSNCILLYLIATIIPMLTKNEQPAKWNILIGAFFVISLAGSSETSMIGTLSMLFFILLYDWLASRKINYLFATYFFISEIASLILFTAPGNSIRETFCTDSNKHQIFFTIKNSITQCGHDLIKWSFNWQIIFLGILSALFVLKSNPTSVNFRKNALNFFFILFAGFFVLSTTYTGGFWTRAQIAPERTINVTYWMFIIYFISLIFLGTRALVSTSLTSKKINFDLVFILFFIVFLFTIKSSGNYFTACNDILSGKAYRYEKEYMARDKTMLAATNQELIELPSFSAFPSSIWFEDDVSENQSKWTNIDYANYYHQISVKSYPVEPFYSHKFLLNYDTKETTTLSAASVTNEIYFSPPNCSMTSGANNYGGNFEMTVKDFRISDVTKSSKAYLSAMFYPADDSVNAVLVFCASDPNGKQIYWSGVDINTKKCPKEKWTKQSIVIADLQNVFSNPENKIFVYVWNRSTGKLYTDDLCIAIY